MRKSKNLNKSQGIQISKHSNQSIKFNRFQYLLNNSQSSQCYLFHQKIFSNCEYLCNEPNSQDIYQYDPNQHLDQIKKYGYNRIDSVKYKTEKNLNINIHKNENDNSEATKQNQAHKNKETLSFYTHVNKPQQFIKDKQITLEKLQKGRRIKTQGNCFTEPNFHRNYQESFCSKLLHHQYASFEESFVGSIEELKSSSNSYHKQKIHKTQQFDQNFQTPKKNIYMKKSEIGLKKQQSAIIIKGLNVSMSKKNKVNLLKSNDEEFTRDSKFSKLQSNNFSQQKSQQKSSQLSYKNNQKPTIHKLKSKKSKNNIKLNSFDKGLSYQSGIRQLIYICENDQLQNDKKVQINNKQN